MTKQEFAIRLLFWLFPWPISKALPRSLRIRYYGPSGIPEPGWNYIWGTLVFLAADAPPFSWFIEHIPDEQPPWWPPDVTPWDEFILNPPDEPPPWFPIDPMNPPPLVDFPDVPDGPVNPYDPYTPGPPGPGGPNIIQPKVKGAWESYVAEDNWIADIGIWDPVEERWEPEPDGDGLPALYLFGSEEWTIDFRPSYMRLTMSGDVSTFEVFIVDYVGHELGTSATYSSGEPLALSWLDDNIDYLLIRGELGVDYYVTDIEFYS